MIRSMLKDVGLETMYSMRREGMNNQAIADALGVTRGAVYRHIGKQPPELRSPWGGHSKSTQVAKAQAEEAPARLPVTNRTVTLKGAHLCYDLDLKDRSLQIADAYNRGIQLPLAALRDVIAELRCIAKGAESLKLENEIW